MYLIGDTSTQQFVPLESLQYVVDGTNNNTTQPQMPQKNILVMILN